MPVRIKRRTTVELSKPSKSEASRIDSERLVSVTMAARRRVTAMSGNVVDQDADLGDMG
jgi:hypothetical protein